MPFTDLARHPLRAEDLPRCPAHPSKADQAADQRLRRGRWECALPAGHTRWPDVEEVERRDGDLVVVDVVDLRRFHRHSWANTAED